MQKSGAVELSIGTIVIIVLAMSMLILGLVLVKNIFSGATDVVDMTNDQLIDQVSKLFGDDKKLVVYPTTREITVKIEKKSGFGVVVKNLLKGTQDTDQFSYEVIVSDADLQENCGVDEATVLRDWVTAGRTDTFPIAPGEFASGKVLIQIPSGAPICNFRLRVNVKHGEDTYASELMDVIIEG
jgi:hypothetical protein